MSKGERVERYARRAELREKVKQSCRGKLAKGVHQGVGHSLKRKLILVSGVGEDVML
jgi:hypothetical protein